MKWRYGLAALLLIGLGADTPYAGVSCSIPFQLQNNTVADATQVMANYNALVTCLSNAASAGSNSDITSLNALTTPITPAQGGTFTYISSVDGGSTNAYTATVSPTGFSLTKGYRVEFIPAASNSGASTLNVNGSGVTAITRAVVGLTGPRPLVGGELSSGVMTEVVYDGTQFVLTSPPVTVGTIVDYAVATPPAGYALSDGSCISQTGSAASLFAVIGSGFGVCGAGTFATPDLRGRVAVSQDGGAGRITTQCFSGVFAAGCGVQQFTLAAANLPNITSTVTGTITVGSLTPIVVFSGAAPTSVQVFGSGSPQAVYLTDKFASIDTFSGTGTSLNANTAVNNLPPMLVLTKMIKL